MVVEGEKAWKGKENNFWAENGFRERHSADDKMMGRSTEKKNKCRTRLALMRN